MRKLSWLSAAALVVGVSLGVSAQETKKAGDAKKEIAWAKNYQEAVETAKKSGKLIMVDFYTDWCGWCKVLDQKTYTDANVIKLADASFVSLKINAEKEGTAQAKRYGVTGFPTILFLDASKLPEVGSEGKGKAGDGEVVGKIVGFKDAGPFALDMTGIAKAAKEYPALAARVEKDASDLEAIGKFAVVLHQRGNAQKAAQTLDKGEKLAIEALTGTWGPEKLPPKT